MYAFNGGGGAFALQLSARVSSGNVMLHELVGSMGTMGTGFGTVLIGTGFVSGTVLIGTGGAAAAAGAAGVAKAAAVSALPLPIF